MIIIIITIVTMTKTTTVYDGDLFRQACRASSEDMQYLHKHTDEHEDSHFRDIGAHTEYSTALQFQL